MQFLRRLQKSIKVLRANPMGVYLHKWNSPIQWDVGVHPTCPPHQMVSKHQKHQL